MSTIVEIYIVGVVVTLVIGLAVCVPVYWAVTEIIDGGYGRMDAPDAMWTAMIFAFLWPGTTLVLAVLGPLCVAAAIYHTCRWTCRAGASVVRWIVRVLKSVRPAIEDASEATR